MYIAVLQYIREPLFANVLNDREIVRCNAPLYNRLGNIELYCNVAYDIIIFKWYVSELEWKLCEFGDLIINDICYFT